MMIRGEIPIELEDSRFNHENYRSSEINRSLDRVQYGLLANLEKYLSKMILIRQGIGDKPNTQKRNNSIYL